MSKVYFLIFICVYKVYFLIFQKLVSSVTHLDLSYNEIQVIENLETLSELSTLVLLSNKISNLESLHTKLGNIQTLHLSSNKIKSLQGSSFIFLSLCGYVYCSFVRKGNKIFQITLLTLLNCNCFPVKSAIYGCG